METIFIVSYTKHRIDELLADLAEEALTSLGVNVIRDLPSTGGNILMVFNGVFDASSEWCNSVDKAMKDNITYYMVDDHTTTIPKYADYIISQFTNGHPLYTGLTSPIRYFQISLLGSLLPKHRSKTEFDFVYWGHYKPEREEKYKEHIPNAGNTLIIGEEEVWKEHGFDKCTYKPYSRNMDELYSMIASGRRTAVFGDKYHDGVNIPLRYYEGVSCGLITSIDKDLLGGQVYPEILSANTIGILLLDVLGLLNMLKVEGKPNTQLEHSTTDAGEILSERAKIYGSYTKGVDCRAQILRALNDKYIETHNGDPMPMGLTVMFSDLALKLMRIASDPTHVDSYVDLEGYAKLIKETQC